MRRTPGAGRFGCSVFLVAGGNPGSVAGHLVRLPRFRRLLLSIIVRVGIVGRGIPGRLDVAGRRRGGFEQLTHAAFEIAPVTGAAVRRLAADGRDIGTENPGFRFPGRGSLVGAAPIVPGPAEEKRQDDDGEADEDRRTGQTMFENKRFALLFCGHV